MKLFNSFTKAAPNKVFLSLVLGALAGVLYSMLIPLVLSSIGGSQDTLSHIESDSVYIWDFEISQYKLAMFYLSVCLLILVIRSLSEIILIRVATDVSRDTRVSLYKQIQAAPIEAIERIGASKMITSINIDVPRVVMGARILPTLIVNGITIIGLLAFLLYLNSNVFKIVIFSILFGVVCYQIPMLFGRRLFIQARRTQDELQKSYEGMIQGAKELKLDTVKRQNYFKRVLLSLEQDIVEKEKSAQTIIRATISMGDLLSFFVIGVVSFVFLNYYAITREELVGIVMALLYLVGPMGVILNAIPQLTRASISYRKINQLIKAIPKEAINTQVTEVKPWHKIDFNQVEYQYADMEDETGFKVGPISFEINRGEITFIVGANGSGKSTLSKMLTMHYRPTGGNISFDHVLLTQENVSSYRQQVGAIFSDYFLFDRILIELDGEMDSIVQEYLEQLHLSEKVKVSNGKFSTLALSDGQRKRLALLVAFLEDKDLYLFDEWAADQDPIFKSIFYRKILPELRDKGKAVVVISHDERYFDVADQMLVMEQGKLISSEHARAIASPVDFAVAGS